jgi:hypothetical protein
MPSPTRLWRGNERQEAQKPSTHGKRIVPDSPYNFASGKIVSEAVMRNARLRGVGLLVIGICLSVGALAQDPKPSPPGTGNGTGTGGATGAGSGTATGTGSGTAKGTGAGTATGAGTGKGTVRIVAPNGSGAGSRTGTGVGSATGSSGTPSGAGTGSGTGQGTGSGTGTGTGADIPTVQGRPLVTDTNGRCYYFTATGKKRYVAPSRCGR